MRARHTLFAFFLAALAASSSASQPQDPASSKSQQLATPSPAATEPRKSVATEKSGSPPYKSNFKVDDDLLEQVNSCDSACSDQLAGAVNPHPAARRKQSPSNIVEKSKQDQHWQALLAEAIATQSQSCKYRSANVRDTKTAKGEKEITRRIDGLSALANAHIKTVADSYLAKFMRMQINRIWNAPCPSYVAHIPSRRDPEDAEAQKDESATNDAPDDNR